MSSLKLKLSIWSIRFLMLGMFKMIYRADRDAKQKISIFRKFFEMPTLVLRGSFKEIQIDNFLMRRLCDKLNLLGKSVSCLSHSETYVRK